MTRRVVAALGNSYMRSQMALTLAAFLCEQIDIGVLPAAYNAANDAGHLAANGLRSKTSAFCTISARTRFAAPNCNRL